MSAHLYALIRQADFLCAAFRAEHDFTESTDQGHHVDNTQWIGQSHPRRRWRT